MGPVPERGDAVHQGFERDRPGLHLLVVRDHHLDTVETYGPMSEGVASAVAEELRGLLEEQGPSRVTVALARLHIPVG